METDFNPRAPCGARLHCPDKISTQFLFQPTRPLRGATRRRRCAGGAMQISTHAPLAGRDTVSSIPSRTLSHFNPRAPCGARPAGVAVIPPHNNFNPRAPCGARPNPAGSLLASIQFQPTRPLRGATFTVSLRSVLQAISTHAPLAGRDHPVEDIASPYSISTHAPLAGRDWETCAYTARYIIFQPTRPLRGATVFGKSVLNTHQFQPTRPLRGATFDPAGI